MIALALRRKNRRVGSLVGLVVGFCILGFAMIFLLIFVIPAAQARLSGVKTVGTVQSLSDCTDDSGGDGGDVALRSMHPLEALDSNVQPTIEFTDLKGQRYSVVDTICGDYAIGEQVVLWYVPDNPSNIALEQDQTTVVVLGGIFGVMALVGLIVILFALARMAWLALRGAPSAGQPNAYAVSPAQASGWQTNISPQMGGWQVNGPAQMGGWPVSAAPQMGGQPSSGNGVHRLGEAVYVAGQWAITVTNAYPSQGTELMTAAPGRYYLMLPLSLRNISQGPQHFSQTTFRLTDNIGAEYQRASLLESTPPGFLQQGDQTSLTLAYDVPGTQRQFRLSFYLSTSSIAQAVWDIAL